MKVQRYEDVPVAGAASKGFRSGDIEFRDLMVGDEGRPDNFGLQMVDVPGGYATPRHRHNFEQVRIMLEGSFGFGPGQLQEEGSIGYFCEGTYYTQDGRGKSKTLLLQIGGPTGQGFMSRRQLRAGIDALRARGEFVDGVYTWLDKNGKKHNQDSYEAVWEHVFGRAVGYPKPQYDAPILMRPERYRYSAVDGQPGVSIKRIARFNDRGLDLSQLQVAAGARCLLDAQSQPYLLFCIDGRGQIGGQSYVRWTSAYCQRGERVTIEAKQTSEFHMIGIPVFDSMN